ncbi:MAG: transcription-repair coupling factor [Bacilli bacterium]|nr:transcription-repair coupling factor [Bacilli bacterium]
MNILKDLLKINDINNIAISGMNNESFCVYLNNLFEQTNKDIIVVTNSLYEANSIYSSLSNYNSNVFLFPMDDFLTSEAIAISPDLLINRMETLKGVVNLEHRIIVTHLMGYLRFLPTKKKYLNSILNLAVGDTVDPKILFSKLVNIGYVSETLVTKTGDVGLRGYVIDVFSLGSDYPCRIEFFGDEIDSIRIFDPSTQKSIKNIDEIKIYPFFEFLIDKQCDDFIFGKQKYLPLYSNNITNISEYLDDPIGVFVNYDQMMISYKRIVEESFDYKTSRDINFSSNYMFDFKDLSFNNIIYYMQINNIITDIDVRNINYNIRSIEFFNEDKTLINNYINNCISNGKTVVVALPKRQMRSIIKVLNMKIIETSLDSIMDNVVNLVDFPMSEGFSYDKYVFITQKEIFKKKVEKKKYKTSFKYASKINDINKLNIGDYVVHVVHGIGIYNGVKKITFDNLEKDYIEVLYQGNDKIYIPVEKIDNLNKFAGKEGTIPKINKLGGTEWKKTKARVSQRVCDMADELIKLYSERESRKGFRFSEDTDLQKDFEADFSYDLTLDQKKAIAQIKKDMESISPMDRLLCGDVGFGKTEVAFVASFKAIMDSKQVLFLCPTTILSNQHYESAKQRFKNFPVSIALLNRFTTKKEVMRIIKGLKDKTIDMVIGTHRLLSEDVQPNDLGLLIIDEEQRFGVKHKEKIKQYRTNIDVLTLTATPIPRTLQMSMSGIRSLSLLETPPNDRYPVQTYVLEENDQIIKDAIYRELSRDGQIFILYNKIEDIELKMLKIQRLVPNATINYAHGRMNKDELESRMLSFINKEFDILVCTTIIETGIDIPNVNTLIILDADRFGLSQLYQIRGRVGRSNKFAYAYLMYSPNKLLTETAVKRLNVIKEFTELGSGFSIATRDLSIRGAGDILGSEQAGFIDTVGMDMYLRMLNNEIARRKGEELEEEKEEVKPYINVTTHIKDSYVSSENLKIEIHRKINTISSKETYLAVKNELEDRFGKLDEDMIIYMYEEWFEKLAKKLDVINVRQTKNYIECIFNRNIVNYISIDDLFVESFKISNMFRFKQQGNNLVIILDIIKLDKHPIYYLVDLFLLILGNNS